MHLEKGSQRKVVYTLLSLKEVNRICKHSSLIKRTLNLLFSP